MKGKLSIGVSLLIVAAAFVAVSGPAFANHAPTAVVNPGTIYEKGSTGQTTSATFTGSYSPHDGETKLGGSEIWRFPDNGEERSGAVVSREFKDAGTWVVTFSVTVSKPDGSFATYSKDVPVTVVNPPPTATHVVPNIVSGAPLEVNFDLTDNQGIQSATLFYRHQGETAFLSQAMSAVAGAAAGAQRYTYRIPASYLSSPVEYYATATDVSKAPQTATYRPTATTYYLASGGAGDQTPPTVTLVFTGTQVVSYGTSFAFVIGMSDASGIKSAAFNYKRPSDAAFTTVNVDSATRAAAIPWSPGIAGTYQWYATATDNQNNVGSLNTAGSPGTLTLSVGPKLGLDVPPGTQKLTPGANLVLSGNVSDDKTGPTATMTYNTGTGWTSGASGLTLGGETNTAGAAPFKKTLTATIPMPGSEFARDILAFVNATDSESNAVTSGLIRISVSTDATKPTISAESPVGAIQAPAAISATFADAGGSGINVASATMKIDGVAVPAADLTVSETGITLAATKAAVTGLTEAAHTIVVTVADKHGNSETKTWTFTLDKTAPTISGERTGFVKNAEQKLSATDAGSGLDSATATIDGAAATAALGDGDVIVSKAGLADGAHAVVLKVKDKAGNEATKEWSFTLDTVAPTIGSASLDATATTLKPTITVTFSDAGSGVKSSSATLKIGGVLQTVTATATGFTFTPTADLKAGANSVDVTVEDNAGNTATLSKTLTIKLPDPPAKKGWFFGLPGFEVLLALGGLAAAGLALRRRS